MNRTGLRQLEVRFIAFVVCTFLTGPVVMADWRNYGGDPGSHKYAPLDQINESTVKSLRVAWSWDSPDNALVAEDPSLTAWGFKSSPLMIDGVLYISTSLNQVAAIEASTGSGCSILKPGSSVARPISVSITVVSVTGPMGRLHAF